MEKMKTESEGIGIRCYKGSRGSWKGSIWYEPICFGKN